MSTRTFTRTHVYITFSSPYLTCDTCGGWVTSWHDPDPGRCGCETESWNQPCGHKVGVTSACPSWGPVDGCTCRESFGRVPHSEPPSYS